MMPDGPREELLLAVDPSRAVASSRGVLPADDHAAIAGDRRWRGSIVPAISAAEIDHAGGFFPAERAREVAAVPRQPDDHLAVVAGVVGRAQEIVARRGVRHDRSEQPPLGGALPDRRLRDVARVVGGAGDRVAVAAHRFRRLAADVHDAGGRQPVKAATRDELADHHAVRADVARQRAGGSSINIALSSALSAQGQRDRARGPGTTSSWTSCATSPGRPQWQRRSPSGNRGFDAADGDAGPGRACGITTCRELRPPIVPGGASIHPIEEP